MKNVVCCQPLPLADGCQSAVVDSVIAVNPHDNRSIKFLARIVEIKGDEYSIRWFEKIATSERYRLSELVDTVHAETVICSGVPMQYIRLDDAWQPLLPPVVITLLSKIDHGISK
jgi:hypothetical protein